MLLRKHNKKPYYFHILIPGSYEDVTLCGKREIADARKQVS